MAMAAREAREVDYRWRLGAVIAHGGVVLSSGRVRYRHDPAIHPHSATWHAEQVALRRHRARLPKGC